MLDLIFIAGAPGSGKSTIAKGLQKRLCSPYFEFGWIPEFRDKPKGRATMAEEEQLSFENLKLVLKNYLRHGYRQIIVTDLNDQRLRDLYKAFHRRRYLLLTLTVNNEGALRKRVLDAERPSGYRDTATAWRINQMIVQRPLLPREIRFDNSSPQVTAAERRILKLIVAEEKRGHEKAANKAPRKNSFYSYL
jgi:shikimate kinase